MQISAHTPQAELERLFDAVTQREMLRSTPLNLRMFLRYAVLFVLFPGMVMGFRVGMALTLLFCVALAGLLLGDMQDVGVAAVRVWLATGVCALVWVSCGTVRSALALRRLRRTSRPADGPVSSSSTPAQQSLRWRRAAGADAWESELELSQSQGGICALLLEVEGSGRGRLLTPERRGVCIVQSVARGSNMQAILLYRLAPGTHCLRWVFIPERPTKAAPKGKVLRLAEP